MGVNVAPGLGLTFIKLDDPVKMPLVEKGGWHLHHDHIHFHFPHISVLFSSAATVCQLNWLAGLIACQSTRWKKVASNATDHNTLPPKWASAGIFEYITSNRSLLRGSRELFFLPKQLKVRRQSLVGRLSGCHQNESKNQTAFMSSWFQLTGQRTLKGPASILLSVSTLIDSQVTSVTGQRCRLSISHKGSCVLRQSAEISTGSLLKSDLYKSLLLLVLSFILTYQVHERERFRGLKGEEQN